MAHTTMSRLELSAPTAVVVKGPYTSHAHTHTHVRVPCAHAAEKEAYLKQSHVSLYCMLKFAPPRESETSLEAAVASSAPAGNHWVGLVSARVLAQACVFRVTLSLLTITVMMLIFSCVGCATRFAANLALEAGWLPHLVHQRRSCGPRQHRSYLQRHLVPVAPTRIPAHASVCRVLNVLSFYHHGSRDLMWHSRAWALQCLLQSPDPD